MVEFLLDGFVEAEHADEIPGGSLAPIEMNESRLVLKLDDFWNSDFPIDFDKAVLLEKEEEHASHFVRNIRRPICLTKSGEKVEFTRSVSGSGAVTKISFFLDLRFLSLSIFAMASDLMILPTFSQQKV